MDVLSAPCTGALVTIDDREFREKLMTTPWCQSWLAKARPGDRFDPVPERRAGAWAQWALLHLQQQTGSRERSYPAIVLDGKFHDPRGQGPLLTPHLEIPEWVMSQAQSSFPYRLAEMGNALAFSWWMVPEVTACKRALFNAPGGDVVGALDMLWERRGALVDSVTNLRSGIAPSWALIEEIILSEPQLLLDTVAGEYSTEEISDFLPAAREHQLTLVFDEKLRAGSGDYTTRRVGVWQLHGVDKERRRFALGVLTPRLTANSQLNDRMFSPETESCAALLVRGLMLRRIKERHLGLVDHTRVVETPVEPVSYFRSMKAQVNQKLPEASSKAAVQFLQTYPDADAAWVALSEWAGRAKCIITVREDAFRQAHRRALRFARRAEEVERDDINTLLPLAWDNNSSVIRVGFSKKS